MAKELRDVIAFGTSIFYQVEEGTASLIDESQTETFLHWVSLRLDFHLR